MASGLGFLNAFNEEHPTTSVWKMPLSWHWTDHWRLLAASGAMH